MTDTVIVYGHSDDLIEVEGALSAELTAGYGEPTTIRFDDGRDKSKGREFVVEYDGEWHFECTNPGEMHHLDYSDLEIYDVGVIDVFNDYTEVVIYRSWDGVDSVEVVE